MIEYVSVSEKEYREILIADGCVGFTAYQVLEVVSDDTITVCRTDLLADEPKADAVEVSKKDVLGERPAEVGLEFFIAQRSKSFKTITGTFATGLSCRTHYI